MLFFSTYEEFIILHITKVIDWMDFSTSMEGISKFDYADEFSIGNWLNSPLILQVTTAASMNLPVNVSCLVWSVVLHRVSGA